MQAFQDMQRKYEATYVICQDLQRKVEAMESKSFEFSRSSGVTNHANPATIPSSANAATLATNGPSLGVAASNHANPATIPSSANAATNPSVSALPTVPTPEHVVLDDDSDDSKVEKARKLKVESPVSWCRKATIVMSDRCSSSIHVVPDTDIKDLFAWCLTAESKWFFAQDMFPKQFILMCIPARNITHYKPGVGLDMHEGTCVGFHVSGGLGFESYPCLNLDSFSITAEESDVMTTHVSVGLPECRPMECYSSDTVVQQYRSLRNPKVVHNLTAGDVSRLIHGQWITEGVINWFGCYFHEQRDRPEVYSTKCVSSRTHGSFFFAKITQCLHERGDLAKLFKWTEPEFIYDRMVYPTFVANHWTLAVFDVPKECNRDDPCLTSIKEMNGRLLLIDPKKTFDSVIRENYMKWLHFRGYEHHSLVHTDGGIQGDNIMECGVFCLQNMELLYEWEPFFDIKKWRAMSSNRKIEHCVVDRQRYAAIVREHIVRWLKAGEPIGTWLLPEHMLVRVFTCACFVSAFRFWCAMMCDTRSLPMMHVRFRSSRYRVRHCRHQRSCKGKRLQKNSRLRRRGGNKFV